MTAPTIPTRQEFLDRMDTHWNDFDSFLSGLSTAQLTDLHDEGGWAAKDHIAHCALWVGALTKLLHHTPLDQGIDLVGIFWEHDFDYCNVILKARTDHLSAQASVELLRANFAELRAVVETFSEEDLHLPYNHFDSTRPDQSIIMAWIAGLTYRHFHEHRPWIEAIVAAK